MTHSVWPRTALLCSCLLLALPLSAAERRAHEMQGQERGRIATLWRQITVLVPLLETLGAGMDPLGQPTTATPQPPPASTPGETDLGAGMDPLG